MEVYQAIHERRTIKNFKPDPVPAEVVERIFAAAVCAQNHGMTQPWRFRLLGPETREALASANEAARPKLTGHPLLIAISQVLANDPEVRREDYAATACAIQNMALAAWGEGICMIWSTGKHTRHESVPAILGISSGQEEIVGFLAFGVPELIPAAPPRKPVSEVVRILP